jgi:large subunit ribosomal protein L29
VKEAGENVMAKGTTANDLKEKSDAELAELLRTSKNELFTARFENFTNKLNDTAKIRRLRKDIARVQTVLSARRRGGEKKAEG